MEHGYINSPNDGGPAFPSPPAIQRLRGECEVAQWNPGLSLRDYFAGMALQGYLAGRNNDDRDTHRPEVAFSCYQYADAMLKARSVESAPKQTRWLIWSHEHKRWWGPCKCGYEVERGKAGVYSYEDACDIVNSANRGLVYAPNEAIVPELVG